MGYRENLDISWFNKVNWNSDKPWKIQKTMWRRFYKKVMTRQERHRANKNPECQPLYKKFYGFND